MQQFDEHSNGSKIELNAGEEFRIILRENPTTGFRWNLISSGVPVCILLDNSFELIDSSSGKGGRHYWHFQSVQEGVGKIEFAYLRSWELGRPPAQSFTLSVSVRT